MAVAGVIAGYLPYHFWGQPSKTAAPGEIPVVAADPAIARFDRRGQKRKSVVFLGAAISVLVSAGLALIELRISEVPVPGPIARLSLAWFGVNALLEGGITLAVIQALEIIDPGWVRTPAGGGRRIFGTLGLAALLLAVVGVLFAAGDPDSLEKLAENLGIAAKARVLMESPLSDYETHLLRGDWLRKSTAGLAGLGLVFAACVLFGRMLSRRRRR
jgi:hypothetical protein